MAVKMNCKNVPKKFKVNVGFEFEIGGPDYENKENPNGDKKGSIKQAVIILIGMVMLMSLSASIAIAIIFDDPATLKIIVGFGLETIKEAFKILALSY